MSSSGYIFGRVFGVFGTLLFVLLFPSFVFVFFKQSSLATGLLLASVAAIFLHLGRFCLQAPAWFLWSSFIGGGAIFLSSLYSLFAYEEIKPLASLSILFPFFAAFLIFRVIQSSCFENVFDALCLLFFVLAFLGVLKFLYIPGFWGYEFRPKAVFPFSEESHYALSLGVVALSLIWAANLRFGFFVVLVLSFFSITYPSLTMLVFSFLGVMILSFKRIFLLLPAFLLSLCVLPFIFSSDYFSDRLDFGGNNLTALVFIQGLDLISYAIKEGSFWGVGYQMLGGFGTPSLSVSEDIYRISGRYMNIDDGGFLAAKLISEFGFLGLLLVLFYVLALVWIIYSWLFRKGVFSIESNLEVTGKAKIAAGAAIGLVVEVFFRGYGYFSPTLFWALIFVPFLFSKNRHK